MVSTWERPSRKSEILDVFARLVAAEGYDTVSIREIAEAMGMSKGTILHHYGSKDRMLEELHNTYMQRRLREAHALVEALPNPREQLIGMVLLDLFAMHRNRDATIAFAREITRFQADELMADVRRMRREYLEVMEDILARGMDEALFRREDPTMVALQILGMVNWTWTWLREDGPWRIEELGESFVRLVVAGVDVSHDTATAVVTPELVGLIATVIDDAHAPTDSKGGHRSPPTQGEGSLVFGRTT
jgi:TetR/AcrR family transcriptional regulator, cholesterol catabolism regulator